MWFIGYIAKISIRFQLTSLPLDKALSFPIFFQKLSPNKINYIFRNFIYRRWLSKTKDVQTRRFFLDRVWRRSTRISRRAMGGNRKNTNHHIPYKNRHVNRIHLHHDGRSGKSIKNQCVIKMFERQTT